MKNPILVPPNEQQFQFSIVDTLSSKQQNNPQATNTET
jgi:hypothetical protein